VRQSLTNPELSLNVESAAPFASSQGSRNGTPKAATGALGIVTIKKEGKNRGRLADAVSAFAN
jgi:hypothetical protein